MFQPRYDPEREIYRDCQWCNGKGCLQCPREAEKEYKRQFPDGPKPIATFDMTDPKQADAARKSIGAEALTKAFGEGGGGVEEIIGNLAAIQ
jgi:hypothetical protein